ncbi:MAG: hypothetical protein KC586_19345, partial [Myxococcales bacterium]|nr:hypothetical protein [Myxococcales bacterium]
QWSTIFTMVAATGVILAALYMLHAVLKMFWGPVSKKENENLPDMTGREWAAVAPLLVLVFWIGFFPNTFLEKSEDAVGQFIGDFRAKWDESSSDDSLRLWHPDLHVAPEAAEPGEPTEEAAQAEPAADGQREAALPTLTNEALAMRLGGAR